MKIRAWESFKFSELWKITEYRDGCIFKMKNTGYVVSNDRPAPEGYEKVTISWDDPNEILSLKLWSE